MRTRWLGAVGTVVAVMALAGVAGPSLVHTPKRAAAPLASAVGVAGTEGTAAVISDSTTTSSPATVPEVIVPEATVPEATVPEATLATATTVATATTTSSAIGAQALALISYPWTKLGYTLAFHGPRAGFFGLTDCRTHNIDIYVTPSQTVVQVAYITAFEIGHAVDCAHLTDGHQDSWPTVRGFQLAGSWFPSCSCSEDRFASGDFSEVFARWQVGPAYSWRSTLAPAPTAAQLTALIPLFG